MVLRSVGPETMQGDEQKIGKNYKPWLGLLYTLIPLITAHYFDTKWVVASGFAVLLFELNDISGRLFDLCIRLRRTNIILNDHHSDTKRRL